MRKMKLPNGFGSITKLKRKNIRNPYYVRICVGKTETGRPILKGLKPQTYFATYNEAYMALMQYHENPFDLTQNVTLEDLYKRKYERDEIIDVYKSAWRYCTGIKNIPVRDIRTKDIKMCVEYGIADGHTAPPTLKMFIKTLLCLLLDDAIQEDLVDTNYARNYKLPKSVNSEMKENRQEHVAFTEEELNILWENSDLYMCDMILIQCYSGWRPKELCELKISDVDVENWTFTGGLKTEAGKNRIVPIHSCIQGFVKARYEESVKYGSEYLFSSHKSNGKNIPITYSNYRKSFNKIMDRFGMEHRPHDPRKTFITLAKKYTVDEYAIKRLVGHYIADLTERIYTDRDVEWLRSEIEKVHK